MYKSISDSESMCCNGRTWKILFFGQPSTSTLLLALDLLNPQSASHYVHSSLPTPPLPPLPISSTTNSHVPTPTPPIEAILHDASSIFKANPWLERWVQEHATPSSAIPLISLDYCLVRKYLSNIVRSQHGVTHPRETNLLNQKPWQRSNF